MKITKLSRELFIRNRQKLQERLDEKTIAIFYSSDEYPRNGDQTFPFRQDSNLFYLSGIEQPNTTLVIGKNFCTIFTNKPDPHTETWTGHILSKEEVKAISGIKTVRYDSALDKTLDNLQTKYKLLGQEDKRLKNIMASLRAVKEPEELDALKRAIEITKNTYLKIKDSIKVGMMEYEVEAMMIYEFLRQGAKGHSFSPIVASGENALCLHYCDNDSELMNNELVLLDFGCEYENYAADLSMTIPINGVFSPRQQEVYNKVLEIHNKVKKEMVKGATINKLNYICIELIKDACIALGLFTKEDLEGDEQIYKQYYPHGVSHFLGLDAHDVGAKDLEFLPNMVLTCEPGLYIKEENIGIRIETDVLITETQPIDLFALV